MAMSCSIKNKDATLLIKTDVCIRKTYFEDQYEQEAHISDPHLSVVHRELPFKLWTTSIFKEMSDSLKIHGIRFSRME